MSAALKTLLTGQLREDNIIYFLFVNRSISYENDQSH